MSIPFEFLCSVINLAAQAQNYYHSLYDYMSLIAGGSMIVEIGVWQGLSTVTMGAAIKGTKSHIIAIDPIFILGTYADPSVNQVYYSSFAKVQENISALGLDGYISFIPDHSENVLKRWDGRVIDFLYVDGDHSVEAVRRDCEWMQHVRPGGYAAFDDWQSAPGPSIAVSEFLQSHFEWHLIHVNGDPPKYEIVPHITWDVTILQKD